jgi:hypothetical protein
MILRVYAMWKSRTILCVLLFIYVVQTIFSVVVLGIYINPHASLSGTFRARLIVPMQSKAYFPISPATLFSSHDFRSSRFPGCPVLQLLLERPTESHDIFCNSPICSQRCAVDSRSHENPERVSRDVQSNEAVAAQPVHKAYREGWNRLFLHVRRPLYSIYLSFPSPTTPSPMLCFRIAVLKQLTHFFSRKPGIYFTTPQK